MLTLPVCVLHFDPENEQSVIKITLNYAFDQAKRDTEQKDDVVFLGDSRLISAIDPGMLNACQNFQFTNLSAGGASFLESYYLLKYYLEHHDDPGIVVISFVPSIHFFESTIFGHFGLPTILNFKPIDLLETGYLSNYFSLNLDRNRNTLLRLLKTCAGKDTLQINRPFPFFGVTSEEEIKTLYHQEKGFLIWSRDPDRHYIKNAVFRWDKKARDENRTLDPREVRYFKKLMQFIKKNHLRSAFLLLPVHEGSKEVYQSYTRKYWDPFVQQFHFDILDNVPQFYDYTLLVDDSHLNTSGRGKYNRYLIQSGLWDEILDSASMRSE